MSPEQRLIRTMVQSFAEIIERQVLRFENQGAEYERKLAEHRTTFAARTSADEKIIEWLRIKVQDARAERDALRAEVAALQERLRASIARGDFAQMEVAALKSQTPKQHPVKVGEWVRRTDAECDGIYFGRGVIAQVLDILDAPENQYTVSRPEWNGYTVPWAMQYCEPCDPPQTEPVPKLTHPVAVGGYLRRLTGFNTTPAGEVARVTLVDDDDPSQLEYEVMRPNGQKGRWSAKGCEPCDPPAADHDTEAGKAAAESAVKTEPVAEEIKVWDVVEVYQATGKHTAQNDVGFIGTVGTIHLADRVAHVRSGLGMPHMVDLCDVRKVRKVTT